MKRQMTYTLLVGLALMMMSIVVNAETKKERVLWEKRPITVLVNVNNERIIHFPTDIRYWMPDYLKNKVSVLAANGVLYVTAHEPIEKTRVRVQALDSQKMYLIDLIASDEGSVTPELIITDKDYIENQSISASIKSKPSDWYVRLIRFAAQSLYAEEHLMPSDKEITRVKVDRKNTIGLIRGGDIEAIPIASWRGGGFYITAIRLRNLSDKTIPIVYDRESISSLKERFVALYSDLRGNWLSAAVQHHYLAESGHENQEDITSLYLISTRTFTESF